MLAVLEAFTVITAVIGVGGVVGRTDVLGAGARTTLNRTAFYIGMPALMLLTLGGTEPSQVFSPILMISAVSALAVFALYFAIATRVLKRSRGEAAIGASAASVVNAGNLGLPLSAYLFGNSHVVAAVILFQYLVLVPLCLAVLGAETAVRPTVRERVVALVRTPVVVASLAGIGLSVSGYQLPNLLGDTLELVGALAIPTVLLGFGMSLSSREQRPPRAPTSDLILAVVCKVVLMPLAAYALAQWCFDADAQQVTLATVLAALPSAQNVNTYAAVHGRGEGLARDATLITTILSVGTIACIVGVLG